MEHLNKLASEIEELRRTLQKKQEEYNRLTSELTLDQHSTKTISKPTQITNTNSVNIYNPVDQRHNTKEHSEPHTNGQRVLNEGRNDKMKVQGGEKLPTWAIERYSRQILLPEIGVHGQEKLCAARVLIVGAGGLGCPAGAYLAGAGVGEIGIVDYDTVDVTNIHRQFLHSEKDQFISKAESAANSLRSLNSRIKVTPYNVQLASQNAAQIAARYDVVLDCTDNVPSRYLLNDLCVLNKLPLISGSALKMEGQLTIYGYRAINNPNEQDGIYRGPCYRCVFPTPPPPEAVGSCSANGVAGPLPGVIGALQALEAIKYIVGHTHTQLLVERMLIFDGEDMTFRTVKLRPRSALCAVCSENATISQLIDYEVFCKAQAKEKKTQETPLKTELRQQEKEKRMTGQSYYGFRTANGTKKWVQDVPKSERKLGATCTSDMCVKSLKKCSLFEEARRHDIFQQFWSLDWKRKKIFVKSLVDTVPVKRRRVKIKGIVSRKVESKVYHLLYGTERLVVCRVMFLSTLGVKEAMVRCWLTTEDRPKSSKQPIKSINVDTYLDSLPKQPPKCQNCINTGSTIQYINIENVKNQFQLYNLYAQDMKSKNIVPASRKTFSKVVSSRNFRIFKAKNENDICDVDKDHNSLPCLSYEQNGYYYDVNQCLGGDTKLHILATVDLDLQILPPEHRIAAPELAKQIACDQRHLLVDVRSEAEFDMCRIDGSSNYPVEKIGGSLGRLLEEIRNVDFVTFVCRRGNDSQIAAQKVLEGIEKEHRRKVKDLTGGLHAWAKEVDTEFPIY